MLLRCSCCSHLLLSAAVHPGRYFVGAPPAASAGKQVRGREKASPNADVDSGSREPDEMFHLAHSQKPRSVQLRRHRLLLGVDCIHAAIVQHIPTQPNTLTRCTCTPISSKALSFFGICDISYSALVGRRPPQEADACSPNTDIAYCTGPKVSAGSQNIFARRFRAKTFFNEWVLGRTHKVEARGLTRDPTETGIGAPKGHQEPLAFRQRKRVSRC